MRSHRRNPPRKCRQLQLRELVVSRCTAAPEGVILKLGEPLDQPMTIEETFWSRLNANLTALRFAPPLATLRHPFIEAGVIGCLI